MTYGFVITKKFMVIAMAEQKKSTNNTARLVVRILFGVLAVTSLVIMVLISPFGKRLLGKEEVAPETVVETIDGNIATEPLTITTTEKVTEEVSESKTDDNTTPSVSVSVPQPTQPVENPLKNYSILINSYKFNYTEEMGITNAVAKDNENAKMTITPKGDVNYADLCESAKQEHGAPVEGKNLQMANANTFYSSEKDGIKTTVICIDDGGNGSIEVKYQYPTDNADYEKEFDFMISMFKVEK